MNHSEAGRLDRACDSDATSQDEIRDRIAALEKQLRRHRSLALFGVLGVFAIVALGAKPSDGGPGELTVSRLVVVDEKGTPRVTIGSDPPNVGRRSVISGIVLFDAKGDERGGYGTMADGSVVLALDAPKGVGAPMRDRIGMTVFPTGAATIAMMDNATKIPVRLATDSEGGGGIEFLDYDLKKRIAYIKRTSFAGEKTREQSLDGN
jgi:hypothetical protein